MQVRMMVSKNLLRNVIGRNCNYSKIFKEGKSNYPPFSIVLITLFQQISAHLLTLRPILLSQSFCNQNVPQLSNVALNKSHSKNNFSSVYLYHHRIIFGRTTKLGPLGRLFLDPQSTTLFSSVQRKQIFCST